MLGRQKIVVNSVLSYVVHVRAEVINPLNAELNPIRHLLALVGAHHFVHVSSIRVKLIQFSVQRCR
jgi:hypothetical protein